MPGKDLLLYLLIEPQETDHVIGSTQTGSAANPITDFGKFTSSVMYGDNGLKLGKIALSNYTRKANDQTDGNDLEFFVSFNELTASELEKAGYDKETIAFMVEKLSTEKFRVLFIHNLLKVEGDEDQSFGSINGVKKNPSLIGKKIRMKAKKIADDKISVVLSIPVRSAQAN